jgi:hypothetical protein
MPHLERRSGYVRVLISAICLLPGFFSCFMAISFDKGLEVLVHGSGVV